MKTVQIIRLLIRSGRRLGGPILQSTLKVLKIREMPLISQFINLFLDIPMGRQLRPTELHKCVQA